MGEESASLEDLHTFTFYHFRRAGPEGNQFFKSDLVKGHLKNKFLSDAQVLWEYERMDKDNKKAWSAAAIDENPMQWLALRSLPVSEFDHMILSEEVPERERSSFMRNKTTFEIQDHILIGKHRERKQRPLESVPHTIVRSTVNLNGILPGEPKERSSMQGSPPTQLERSEYKISGKNNVIVDAADFKHPLLPNMVVVTLKKIEPKKPVSAYVIDEELFTMTFYIAHTVFHCRIDFCKLDDPLIAVSTESYGKAAAVLRAAVEDTIKIKADSIAFSKLLEKLKELPKELKPSRVWESVAIDLRLDNIWVIRTEPEIQIKRIDGIPPQYIFKADGMATWKEFPNESTLYGVMKGIYNKLTQKGSAFEKEEDQKKLFRFMSSVIFPWEEERDSTVSFPVCRSPAYVGVGIATVRGFTIDTIGHELSVLGVWYSDLNMFSATIGNMEAMMDAELDHCLCLRERVRRCKMSVFQVCCAKCNIENVVYVKVTEKFEELMGSCNSSTTTWVVNAFSGKMTKYKESKKEAIASNLVKEVMMKARL
jgi:hypothetical protein